MLGYCFASIITFVRLSKTENISVFVRSAIWDNYLLAFAERHWTVS